MEKQTLKRYKLLLSLHAVVLFFILSLLFSLTGHYNFCYVEQWNTFVYNTISIHDILFKIGGLAELSSSFLTQFFLYPLAGATITAALLALISLLTADIIHKWTNSIMSIPLSLFPAVSLLFLHYNVNYHYSGSVAILFMLVLVRVYLLFKEYATRLAYSLISALALYLLAGPVAMLYSVVLLLMELSRIKWRSLFYFAVPVLVFLTAKASMMFGLSGTLDHLLLPAGYFTLRLVPGSIIYMPWATIASVFLICGVLRPITLHERWMVISVSLLIYIGVAVFGHFGVIHFIDHKNETFKELNYYAANDEWSRIIERCSNIPMNNMLFQNYLNVALAENGTLADRLFEEPCIDIQTIYVVSNKTPYISTLLSDIYFSMGHIALSQRYAFEANEAVGNFSPRLLKRLIQTNIIFGYYATAQKYIDILSSTLFYRSWAESCRPLLWNDKAVLNDPALGPKRRSLFADNRFSSIKGLDDDLKQIVLANPAHKATIQYLGSLYLLSKDIPRFMQTIETFYGSEALPSKLPLYYQEGVALAANGDEEIIRRYNIESDVVKRLEAFKKEPRMQPHSLWYYLQFRN